MKFNNHIPIHLAARESAAEKRIASEANSRWWRPQLHQIEEAELVSASCQGDLLTVNLTTRHKEEHQLTAVNIS